MAYQHQLEVNKLALRQQYREIAKTEQAAILTLPAGKAVDGSALEEAITNLDAAILEQSAKTETARKAAEVGATETPEGIVESIVKGFLTQRVEDIELKLDLKTLRPIIAKMNHNEALSADELKNLMGALKVVFESTKDLREQLVGEVKRLLEDNKSYVRMGVAAVGGTAGALVMGPLGGAVGAILGKNACDFVFGKAQPQGRIEAIVDGVMSGLGALAGGSVVTALIAAGVSAAHEQDPKVEAALDVGAKATAANAMGAGMATSASIGFLGTLIQGNPGVVREVAADVQHVVGKFREKGFKAVGDVALGFGRLFVSSAKNVVRAGIERKWTELAVRIGVIALPVIAGVLHLSAVGYAVASFILGLYLVEKYFANRPMFAGKATLDNEEFLKAVVARAKEEKAETELERLSNAFNYVLGRVDLNQYDVTTKDEITARLARVDQVKAILAKKFD